jgi:hypothetical protein
LFCAPNFQLIDEVFLSTLFDVPFIRLWTHAGYSHGWPTVTPGLSEPFSFAQPPHQMDVLVVMYAGNLDTFAPSSPGNISEVATNAHFARAFRGLSSTTHSWWPSIRHKRLFSYRNLQLGRFSDQFNWSIFQTTHFWDGISELEDWIWTMRILFGYIRVRTCRSNRSVKQKPRTLFSVHLFLTFLSLLRNWSNMRITNSHGWPWRFWERPHLQYASRIISTLPNRTLTI